MKLSAAFLYGFLCWFAFAFPAAAHHHHHGANQHHCGDCNGCGDCDGCDGPGQSARQARPAASLESFEGAVAEVIYLPGADADSAGVVLRLRGTSAERLVKLAPSGFLRSQGLDISEGDTVSVRGFRVTTAKGDQLIATEVQSHGRTINLRDTRGNPRW